MNLNQKDIDEFSKMTDQKDCGKWILRILDDGKGDSFIAWIIEFGNQGIRSNWAENVWPLGDFGREDFLRKLANKMIDGTAELPSLLRKQ